MKKKIGFFVALLLMFFLTACSKKHPVEKKDEVIGRSTYNCTLSVGNNENITKGSVIVKINEITKDGAELYTTKTLTGFEGNISVTGLKSETDYRADLYCTIDKKSELIYTWTFKTTKDGTEADPYVITTASQLVEAITSDYSSDSFYKLGNDIDFNDYVDEETKEKIKFAGICTTSSTAFAGNFDGNGKTIKNVTITADQAYVGFFGYVKGNIRNVTFDNISVNVKRSSSTTTYVGAVCGYAYGAKFNNCNVTNSKVDVETTSQYVAGLVGYSFATNILNSDVSDVEISSKGASTVYVGGLTSYICQNSNSKYGVISYSNASGNVTVEKSNTLYYGGLVGFVKAGAKISEAKADINAVLYGSKDVYAGGFAGLVNFGNGENTDTKGIKNVVATGKITFTSGVKDKVDYTSADVLIGGLIGSATATEIANAFVDVTLDVTAKMDKDKALYVGSVFGRGYEFHTSLTNGLINAIITTDTTESYSASSIKKEDVASKIKESDIEKTIDKEAITATIIEADYGTHEEYLEAVDEAIKAKIKEEYDKAVDEAYDKEVAEAANHLPKFEIHEFDGSSYDDGIDYLPLSVIDAKYINIEVNGVAATSPSTLNDELIKSLNWDLRVFDYKINAGKLEISFKY